MNKPKRQIWPDGTRVRFTDEARKAMQKRPGFTKPLATPGNGPDVVYTPDNSDDAHHDVVLRETGERYGTYWLTTGDIDPTPDIAEWADMAARAPERPIYVIADRMHREDIDGRTFVEEEIDLGLFTHEAAAQTRVSDLNTPALTAHADATARYDKQLKAWDRKQARAAKLGFSNPDWRPPPPREPPPIRRRRDPPSYRRRTGLNHGRSTEIHPSRSRPMNTNEHPSWQRGNWMQTFTGRRFYPLDPRPEDISILDIAHALSMQCRYNGHVRKLYSVAEHCVLVSRLVAPEHALWALLHDATEAYMRKMIRPLKLHMPEFQAVENKVMLAIAQKFGIAGDMPNEVHEADSRILLDERAALMDPPAGEWGIEGEPFGVEILAWSPAIAELEYLARFAELRGVSLGTFWCSADQETRLPLGRRAPSTRRRKARSEEIRPTNRTVRIPRSPDRLLSLVGVAGGQGSV